VGADDEPSIPEAASLSAAAAPSKRATKRKAPVKSGGSRAPKAARKAGAAAAAPPTAVVAVDRIDTSKLSAEGKAMFDVLLLLLEPALVQLAEQAAALSDLNHVVKRLAKGADTQGELCQRVASNVAVMNKNINLIDLTKPLDREEPTNSHEADMAEALKNQEKLAVSRNHFQRTTKQQMGTTDVTARFFKCSADHVEMMLQCIMESQRMSEEEAGAYAMLFIKLPNQSKTDCASERVSEVILRSKNHLTQKLTTIVTKAYCEAVGISLPTPKKRSKRASTAPIPAAAKKRGGKPSDEIKSRFKGKASSQVKADARASLAERSKHKRAASATDQPGVHGDASVSSSTRAIVPRKEALEWLEGRAYAEKDRGFKGIVASCEAMAAFLDAGSRIVMPTNVGEEKYIFCPLGYPALAGAIMRAVFEKAAGVKPMRRSGIDDGVYENYVNELARQHKWQPKDGAVHRGMKLSDGKDPKRARLISTAAPEAKAAAAVLDRDANAGAQSADEYEGGDADEALFVGTRLGGEQQKRDKRPAGGWSGSVDADGHLSNGRGSGGSRRGESGVKARGGHNFDMDEYLVGDGDMAEGDDSSGGSESDKQGTEGEGSEEKGSGGEGGESDESGEDSEDSEDSE